MDPTQQHQNNQPARRRVFTRNATFTVKRFAATADKPAAGATLTGYALKWNDLSDDRGGYQVRLLPGSATFTDPTMALFHHDFASVIGNTQNGTLRITPDDVGVKVDIDLPDTTMGRDVAELVDKGYVQGMSFAMVDAPKFAMKTEGKQQIMEISAFTADEVTVTAIPSFTTTSIEIAAPAPEAEPITASKKSSNKAQDRDAQGWKSEKYRLAGLAELQS